jgi:type I restriction enzyme S subunit
MKHLPLSDDAHFQLVSGLWKGVRAPLKSAKVLRATNFGGDGLLDFDDVVQLDVEERLFQDRRLIAGDIIVERSGGGPKQPVGRIALFEPPDDGVYFSSNFTTTLRVRDRELFDPEFVALYLHARYLSGATETLQRATTGIRNLDWHEYLKFEIPAIPMPEQKMLVRLISGVRRTYRIEYELLNVLTELKRATMLELFARGLRGEAQKETEIGLVPDSWRVVTLGSLGKIGNGSTPKKTISDYWNGGTYPWLTSAKVYDREIKSADQFVTDIALAECHLPRVQPGAVLIAITGQGKTLGHCAVLNIEASINQHIAYLQTDTNQAEPSFVRGYLETQYEYLRQVASGGGSTKGALTCAFLKDLPIPLPSSIDEQREIVTILDALDRKIALHRQKRAVLQELFQSLLHKLMTGKIRVGDLDLSALTPDKPKNVQSLSAAHSEVA